MKDFGFLNILALLTIFSGVICLVDLLFFSKSKQSAKQEKSVVIEYARAFFPVFLVVLLIRAFLVQPYRVPTGSLEPTIIPGDLILVNQYDYGLKLPLWEKIILPIGSPKRGQIALFKWPVNPKITFVKRVIGMPGDHISYINKVFYINGQPMKQTYLGKTKEILEGGRTREVDKYQENLQGVVHNILINPAVKPMNFQNLVIPKGMYFMIGDNRDDSDDSRDWGLVPVHNFIGKALFVWMSWDSAHHRVRWHRIGTSL